MSGLTVIGDIQTLHDSFKVLSQEVKASQAEQNKHYELILSNILSRLEKLEATCFQDIILSEPDVSWDIVRAKRNYLLKATDWTGVSGCTAAPMAWAQYRQELRDLPQRFASADLDEIVWPVQPSVQGPHTIEEEEI
jgi:hypothetical protein